MHVATLPENHTARRIWAFLEYYGKQTFLFALIKILSGAIVSNELSHFEKLVCELFFLRFLPVRAILVKKIGKLSLLFCIFCILATKQNGSLHLVDPQGHLNVFLTTKITITNFDSIDGIQKGLHVVWHSFGIELKLIQDFFASTIHLDIDYFIFFRNLGATEIFMMICLLTVFPATQTRIT